MDMTGLDDGRFDAERTTDGGVDDQTFEVGGDERRMHVRAYNHWVSLLKGRPYPAIADLDPGTIRDFGQHSVLLDFSAGLDDPRIAFLGRTLREECGLASDISQISQVPGRSLLSRLTDHYLQIIANRAPIGFEAEFVGTRGRNTLYRGILMPFSSDGKQIDFIYGVINWKELADAAMQATLTAELAAARDAVARDGEARDGKTSDQETGDGDMPTVDAVSATTAEPVPEPIPDPIPVWADGPGAARDDAGAPPASLDHQLAVARESAAAVRAADTRSRAALYRALGRAHDFGIAALADPDAYRALLDAAAIKVQDRAPMTAVAKLVFGTDYDKTRLTEYAAVLDHARRHGVSTGALPIFLELQTGGIKAVVAAARAERRPQATTDPFVQAQAELRTRPVRAEIDLPGETEWVVLVARREGARVQVLGEVTATGFVQQAVRKAVA